MPVRAASAAGNSASEVTSATSPASTAAASAYAEPGVNLVTLPDIDSWDIPVRCFKCNQPHVEPVRNFMIGNVIFCPHCNKSMVVRDNLNFHVRTLLRDSYDKWQNDQNEFQGNANESLRSLSKTAPSKQRPSRLPATRTAKRFVSNSTPWARLMMHRANPSKKDHASDGAESFSLMLNSWLHL